MATMNLEQIEKKLQVEFAKEGRRIVFWYDERGSFLEDLSHLSLGDVRVMVLKKGEQFRQKRMVESENPSTNYLLYAPFSRPRENDNHFLDMEYYSVLFSVHRIDLVMKNKDIDPSLRRILMEYESFFDALTRVDKFAALNMTEYTKQSIPLGLMAVLADVQSIRLEDILRHILASGNLQENKTLLSFEKYGLLSSFWKEIGAMYGYNSDAPTLYDLAQGLFITYVKASTQATLPSIWRDFLHLHQRNTVVFLDSFMHDSRYSEEFKRLSESISYHTKASQVLSRMPLGSILEVEVFSAVDNYIIKELLKRFKEGIWDDPIDFLTIENICEKREALYFSQEYSGAYHAIKYAYRLLSLDFKFPVDTLKEGVSEYTTVYYKYDLFYRKYGFYYDQIPDQEKEEFHILNQLVEDAYTHRYLDELLPRWGKIFTKEYSENSTLKQEDFYSQCVVPEMHRTIVIISDALRYEVAAELTEKLNRNSRIEARISPMLAAVPTITSVGMAKLLPHESVQIKGGALFVNGKPTQSLEQRLAVLEKANGNATALSAGDARNQKTIRRIVREADKQVVYIYHNMIDAIGDDNQTHHQVFTACNEAMSDLESLVLTVSNHLGASRFFITADHGFLYKRHTIEEDHKIENEFYEKDDIHKRYAWVTEPPETPGIVSLSTADVKLEAEYPYLAFPLSSHIFKTQGGSQNYVHGGISPQESIVPVIEISLEDGAVQKEPAKIMPVLLPNKITNLIQKMDFLQEKPLSDTVVPADYLVFFEAENGDIISNVMNHRADSKEEETSKRIFPVTFTMSDRTYTGDEKYYLVVKDKESTFHTTKKEVKIEVLFAGDFKF